MHGATVGGSFIQITDCFVQLDKATLVTENIPWSSPIFLRATKEGKLENVHTVLQR